MLPMPRLLVKVLSFKAARFRVWGLRFRVLGFAWVSGAFGGFGVFWVRGFRL